MSLKLGRGRSLGEGGGAGMGAGSTPMVAEVSGANEIPLRGQVAVKVSRWPS